MVFLYHLTFRFLLNKPNPRDSRQTGEKGLLLSWREKAQVLDGSRAETDSGIQHILACYSPLALSLWIGRGLTQQPISPQAL